MWLSSTRASSASAQSVRDRSVSNDFRPRNSPRAVGQGGWRLPRDRSVFAKLGRKAHTRRRQRQKGTGPELVVVGEGQVRFAESKKPTVHRSGDSSVSNDFTPRNWTRGVGQGACYLPGDRSVFAKSRKEGSHSSTAASKGTG